jgi:Tol biopolymer transport system component
MKKLLTTIALSACFGIVQAQNPLILREPSINPDGTKIAFSFQGDIWTVPALGGKATRLTIHEAYESNPIFSADGKQIAFNGQRFGENDLFSIPTDGGASKRLTFHSVADNLSSWHANGQLFFTTNREFKQIERPQEIYSISANGGTEKRVLDALGYEPNLSPDGKLMAFVRGDINPVAREAYDGNSNRDIWIFNTQTKSFSKINAFKTNDIQPQWGPNHQLYFLSSQDGAYNIYRVALDANGKQTGNPEKLTSFKNESIRHFSLSADGQSIVFEKDIHIYTMKTTKGNPQVVNVDISTDERLDASEEKTYTSEANQFSVSPSGEFLALNIRGEIFVKSVDKENPRSINASSSAFRDIQPTWLSDKALLFLSDRKNGNYDLYLYRSADTTETNIFKSLKHELIALTNTMEDETNVSISPDGKKISFVRGKGTFIIADIDPKGKITKERILSNGWNPPSDLAWSPDNKWVAYAATDLYFNQEVFIASTEKEFKPVNVSMHPRTDRNPVWSPDGSKLGFISERSVEKSADIVFVWLKKEDAEKEKQDWLEKDKAKPETPAAATGAAAAAKPDAAKKVVKDIQIDLDKIHERVVRVTTFPGDERELAISKDGDTFYYTTNSSTSKGRDLYSIKWDGSDLKEITKGGSNPSNIAIDKDGKYLYYSRMGGGIARIDVKTTMPENFPYVAKLKINYLEERTQLFEEAWRTIRDGFYDPKFHGRDWKALHDKYRERCIFASTSTDFRDMFNLMLGELNSSHMGFTTPERLKSQKENTAYLGVELSPEDQGMRIMRVIPGTPADKVASKLAVGELIGAVNGETISKDQNFYQLLTGLVNEKISLQVIAKDGKTRDVAIRLTNNLADELYEEWVDNRKKMVDEVSKGRLGYLHIRGMDFPSFETVEREFTAAGYGKEGMIIDVRYNGGGSTTDYLMTILNYKQHAYTIPRGASENLEKDKLKFRDYYPIGERLVYAAWTKPSIALCNEGSYSNAEIFSHAYKSLGIGKLVGQTTNGSVISTGGKALIDGSFIRLPGRGWFTKTTDKNQELGAAVPDIMVENEPDWIAKGSDEQLKVAAKELLKELDAKK